MNWRWGGIFLVLGACGKSTTDTAPLATSTTGAYAAPVADGPAHLYGLVGESVEFQVGPDATGTFTWTFGDGQQGIGQSAGHHYDAPGHYTAYLEATRPDGQSEIHAFSVTVTWPVLAESPHQAATVNASDDGRLLFVAMPDFDRVAVVERSTGAILRHVAVCDEPRTVDVSGAAFAVACAADDTVQHYDFEGTLLDSWVLPWGARPYGVVFHGAMLSASLQGSGQLAHLTPGQPASQLVDVGPDLRGIASAEGRLWLTQHRSADSGGAVFRVDSDNGISVGLLPHDPGPDSDTNARGVPTYLQQIAVRPDGRAAFIPGLKANIDRGLVRDGRPLTFETTVRADLRQISLHPDEGPVGEALAYPLFDDRGLGVAARFSPRGDWLFVAHQGMESVDVVDPYSLERAGAVVGMGTSPDGLWVGDDQTLWVSVGLSRQLVKYDISQPAAAVELLRVDLMPADGEVLSGEVLMGKQVFQRSIDPRMSRDGYASCASCHLDGDHDRRVWDFTDRGEGLRNTVSMKGRAGAAPIHWSANFDEIQDFENDIRGPQQGAGFLTEADWSVTSETLGSPKAGLSAELDALAAYASQLATYPRSPYRNPDGSPTANALAGEQLFLDPAVGCADCHSGAEYTDSQWLSPGVPLLHDVGTLSADSGQRMGAPLLGLDTPGLRGLFNSPPYLHDGSAATVREVLVDRNLSDLHGATSGLTAQEIDQLARFLLELE